MVQTESLQSCGNANAINERAVSVRTPRTFAVVQSLPGMGCLIKSDSSLALELRVAWLVAALPPESPVPAPLIPNKSVSLFGGGRLCFGEKQHLPGPREMRPCAASRVPTR
ncbi:hypothetical protein O3P69_016351 [Scylla paramamosain]|uniref:Uncharacterized protein n=1 Tax=Scylla paramamosain TaxID=85552 RepID=A0AAW0TDI1_SCYPA